MKIESILKREGGTKVDLGGTEYHFEPIEDGAHVADVTEEAHIDRLLSIGEAFKVYHGKAAPKGEPKKVEAKEPKAPASTDSAPVGPLAGSEQLPPQFEIGERVVTQLEAVQAAFAASGMTSDEWNELSEDDRTAKIEIALDEMADADEAKTEDKPAAPAKAKAVAAKPKKK